METILVTGANRGIGFALVRRFVASGNRVIATARDVARATELRSLEAEGTLRVEALDVAEADSIDGLARRLEGETVDVLVNNAGILGRKQLDLAELDADAWRRTFEVNALGPFRTTLALLANLRRSRRPRVVTISSQTGSSVVPSGGYYAYGASKAAVNKLMAELAETLASDGIVVCPVHPGWVRTDMGGSNATLSVEESAAGLERLVEGLTSEHSGRFFRWDGTEHPW